MYVCVCVVINRLLTGGALERFFHTHNRDDHPHSLRRSTCGLCVCVCAAAVASLSLLAAFGLVQHFHCDPPERTVTAVPADISFVLLFAENIAVLKPRSTCSTSVFYWGGWCVSYDTDMAPINKYDIYDIVWPHCGAHEGNHTGIRMQPSS